jgi:hypothetical protein
MLGIFHDDAERAAFAGASAQQPDHVRVVDLLKVML